MASCSKLRSSRCHNAECAGVYEKVSNPLPSELAQDYTILHCSMLLICVLFPVDIESATCLRIQIAAFEMWRPGACSRPRVLSKLLFSLFPCQAQDRHVGVTPRLVSALLPRAACHIMSFTGSRNIGFRSTMSLNKESQGARNGQSHALAEGSCVEVLVRLTPRYGFAASILHQVMRSLTHPASPLNLLGKRCRGLTCVGPILIMGFILPQTPSRRGCCRDRLQ